MRAHAWLIVAIVACSAPPAEKPAYQKPWRMITAADLPPPEKIVRERVLWRAHGEGRVEAVDVDYDTHLKEGLQVYGGSNDTSAFVMAYLFNTKMWLREIGTGVTHAVTARNEDIVACGEIERSDHTTDLFVVLFGRDGKERWSFTAGAAGNDACTAVELHNDSVYIAGTISGTANFAGLTARGHGGRDMVIARLDHNGVPLWVATAGGAADDVPRSLAVDDRGLYVAGQYGGPMQLSSTIRLASPVGNRTDATSGFVAMYELTGRAVWAQQIGTTDAHDRASAISVAGDIFVAGDANGSAFLASYDIKGSQRWQRAIAGTARAVLANFVTAAVATYDKPRTAIEWYAYDGARGKHMTLESTGELEIMDMAEAPGTMLLAGRLVGTTQNLGPPVFNAEPGYLLIRIDP